MNIPLEDIISICDQSKYVYIKFISANDSGRTKANQAGFYIAKNSWKMFSSKAGIKNGENFETPIIIRWQNEFETRSKFKWYGSKNEYRITCFGRNFPFNKPNYNGALLIITQCTTANYQAFILDHENDINLYLEHYGLTPLETNCLLEKVEVEKSLTTGKEELQLIREWLDSISTDFPKTEIVANTARH